MKADRTVRDSLLTVLAPVVWGSTYLVTTQLLPHDRPLLAAAMRALPGGLILTALGRTLPSGKWWWRALVLGALNIGVFFYLLFVAAYHLPGGVASLVGSIQPVFVLVLSVLVLRTTVRGRQIAACLVGLAGVGLLVLGPKAGLDTVGVFAGMSAAACMATGIVLSKRWGRSPGVGLLTFTGWQLAVGGILLAPVALVGEGLPSRITWPNVAGFAYLSLVGALLAYAVWFRGIERLPALTVSLLGFASPLAATVLGYVFLGQKLTAVQAVGALAVVAAVLLAQRRRTWKRPRRRSSVNRPSESLIPLRFTEEVAEALHAGQPVVALESNVITHGLPYPDNAATARKVEQAVRSTGAVPATVCIDDGAIRIGMTDADIERFASEPGTPKVSNRDLPVVLAQGGRGATTVASSLVAADLAGIAFFASAGIGGVHRGAQQSMDISSDLVQFTRSKVAVVSAGAKMILDLGLTLEFLETHGVPLVSYLSDDFPAFYCTTSGHRSPHRMDDERAIARAVEAHWALGNHSSFLITTPTRPEDAIDAAEVNAAIEQATAAAARNGVSGQAVTKYLMRAIDAATSGRSAAANMAVLITCAEAAGRLAVAHSEYLADLGELSDLADERGRS